MSGRRGARAGRALQVFVGIALLVLAVIALATVVIARQVAQHDALRDAERATARLAAYAAPVIAGVLAGDAGRRAELDRAIGVTIAEGPLTEADVWRADGTVVYANKPGVIGKRFPPSPQLLAAIRGTPAADLDSSDETGPATGHHRDIGQRPGPPRAGSRSQRGRRAMRRQELSGGMRNDGPLNGGPEPNTGQAGHRGLPARRPYQMPSRPPRPSACAEQPVIR